MRLRVLVVTRNLPPLVGGMERLNWHLIAELAKYADVEVIGPTGARAMAPEGVLVSEVPLRPLRRFLFSAFIKTIVKARRFRPHVVFAGSGLTAPIALLASRMTGGLSVAYVHGLDLTTQHPLYRLAWIPALRRMHMVVANSHMTAALAAQASIELTRVQILHPGVALPSPATDDDVAQFRQRHGFGLSPLLLSVGRLSRRKGLQEFVRHALPIIVAQKPGATLVIVGDSPNDALNAQSQTPQAIRSAAAAAGVERHVVFLGKLSDVDLTSAFHASDVHVFPIRELPNDPEGFGMVAVEAAAHGVPTVAFASGGVIDAVSDGNSGYLVAPGDYSAFAKSVLHAMDRRYATKDSCLAFARQFEWVNFGQQLLNHIVGAIECRQTAYGARHGKG